MQIRKNLIRRHNPVRIGDAAYAAGRLILNPDDTGKYGLFVDAMSGDSLTRFTSFAQKHSAGARLLEEKPDMLAALRKRSQLRRMRKGSLGREYAEFADREGISGDYLAEIIAEDMPERSIASRSENARFLMDWLRDTHDLMHLVLGYHTDILGELGVLTFTGVQTRLQGILISMALPAPAALTFNSGRKVMLGAVRRAKSAEMLALQNWVERLDQPLVDIQKELNVGPAPSYKPLFTPKRRKAAKNTRAHYRSSRVPVGA